MFGQISLKSITDSLYTPVRSFSLDKRNMGASLILSFSPWHYNQYLYSGSILQKQQK